MLPHRILGVLPLLTLATACVTERSEPEVGQPLVESTQRTSDGELIRVRIPEQLPVVEVAEGARCGVQSAEGAMLSCQAGTFCTSPREGVAATCERGLRAPTTH